jgi:hypothetical protein
VGLTPFAELAGGGIDVPNQPMIEGAARRIRIVHDQDKAFGFLWDTLELERRIVVGAFAGELRRDRPSGREGGTCDRDLRRNGKGRAQEAN